MKVGIHMTLTKHLTDLDIANNATLKPISEIAKVHKFQKRLLNNMVVIKQKLIRLKLLVRQAGKVVLVTAISPTPAGEGKSTVTVGLADA